MRRCHAARVILFALATAGCGSSDSAEPFVDWARLRNPILAVEDRSLKDLAVVYEPLTGEFFVFSSVRFESSDTTAPGKPRSFYRTRDLRRFTPFHDPDVNGPGIGPGSPDVTRLAGQWYMVFQGPTGVTNDARVLRYATSTDLVEWEPPADLAPDLLDPAKRNIDGALAEHDGYFYLGWKQVQQFYVTRSVDRVLDGRWLPARRASAGGPNEFAENYQFIRIDDHWRMVATGHDPGPYRCDNPAFIIYTCNHEPFIYSMDGAGNDLDDWTRWIDKTHLQVPFAAWNTVMHANSAYLADWRAYDGYFYLFYAGSTDGDRFDLRGHGTIGVARSRDLVEWRVPPEV